MSPSESALSSKRSDLSAGRAGGRGAGERFRRVVSILLCVEIGIFLLVVPWSEIWGRHSLVNYFPPLGPVYLSYYFRGAVSGLGLINLWLGISQAWNLRRNGLRPGTSEP